VARVARTGSAGTPSDPPARRAEVSGEERGARFGRGVASAPGT
jgi:hypothetical protein